MKKDFQNPHSKYGKISIKINSVKEFRPSKGAVYENALNAAEEMDAESFSFEFSVGRKKNTYLDANVVRSIISDAFNNMGAVSIARVKMTDEQGTDLYNLFDNVKHSIFSMNADNNGEIAFKDISDKMLEAYSRAKI